MLAIGRHLVFPGLNCLSQGSPDEVNTFTSSSLSANMARLTGGRNGCYRCGYVWRPIGRMVHLCPRCKSRSWDVPKLRPITQGRRFGIPEIIGAKCTAVLRLAKESGFEHVRIFGSVRRSQATPKSDVDFLVARGPDASLLDRAHLEIRLEELLHRKVDVVIDEGLHWFIRPQALFEAVTL
jgi:predicted nucleotidyltransferase